ncbi:MAG: hypothetical protein PHN80_03330 [Hespellia sp.]|nr:hypothetical protein [Hespellia sp.]
MKTMILISLYLILCIAIYFITRKFFSKTTPSPCDERQLLARGNAYKCAFLVLLGYLVLCIITQNGFQQLFFSTHVLLVLGICLGFFAFASVSILQDAYLPPKADSRNAAFCLGAISISNIGLGLTLDEIRINDGILEYVPITLMLGITLFLLFLLFIFKQYVLSYSEEE